MNAVTTIEQRFWPKVDRRGPNECWPWLASLDEKGYGLIRPEGSKTRPVRAHRVSAELAGMSIDGICVLHSCDNRRCVNPAHLYLGTHQDNMKDKLARDRQPWGEQIWQAKLTPEKVLEMRRRRRAGELIKALAVEFGITADAASNAIAGVTWARVGSPDQSRRSGHGQA